MMHHAELIAAIAASVAAVVAVIGVAISLWQAHFTTRVQVLLQCDAAWSSESMKAARRKAAKSLLNGDPSADVDRVLDFFETMAGLFIKRHGLCAALPDSWARHTFYWPAICYWSKSRDYIDAVRGRRSEDSAWEDFCNLMPRWAAAEGGGPSPEDIKTFLEDEAAA